MKLIRILCFVRVALVPLALGKLLADREDFPPGYEAAAWWLLAAQTLVALALLLLAFRWRGRLKRLAALQRGGRLRAGRGPAVRLRLGPGQPLRTLPYLVVLEAALFFRLRGGVLVAALTLPVFAAVEIWRESEFGIHAEIDSIVLRGAIAFALGGVVGRRRQPAPPGCPNRRRPPCGYAARSARQGCAWPLGPCARAVAWFPFVRTISGSILAGP